MPHLALQAVRAPGPSINTSLRIKTLLANNLVTEAFELQRSKGSNEQLLIEFFKGCDEHKKWHQVLHLALTEREGQTLCTFLRSCETLLSENLHLLYLLQRNLYIEAISYLDESTRHRASQSPLMQRKLENTRDLIVSSYKLAMNGTSRGLCDQYMLIKNRLDLDVHGAVDRTLSSELNPFIVDANANVVGSLFHRAMISAKKTGINTNKNHIPLLGNIRIDVDPDESPDALNPISEPKSYGGLLKRRKEMTYASPTDPDAKQPAAKRQRTDSFSIGDADWKKHAPGINSYLLTSLTNHSHIAGKRMHIEMDENLDDIGDDDDGSGNNLDDTVANEASPSQRNSFGELCETANLLSTPVVRSSRLEKHNLIESRCHTPQSILKPRSLSRRSLSPSLTVNSAKRSVDFNSKSFCYTIPSQNDEYRLAAIQETIKLRETDEDDSSSSNTLNSIKGRRPIHSGKHSSASNSVDEFYSPETSKVENESTAPEQMDQSDISHIMSTQPEMPTPTTPHGMSTGRKLRSKTPEVVAISSTRITRSRSKLNLDDTDEQESATKQPVLNTSTPKRPPKLRQSPSRFLTKNVLTSNALKVQSEIERSEKTVSETHDLDDNDLVDAAASASKPRNLLKDASELSIRHRSMYGMDTTEEGDGTQSKRDLLHDSSIYSVELSESTKLSVHVDDASVDDATANTEKTADQASEEETNSDESSENEAAIEYVQPPVTEGHVETQSIEVFSTASNDNVSENLSSNVVEVHKVAETTTTVTEETVVVTEKLPTNYLTDSSAAVSDSMMQKFNRYENYTGSFFSETQPLQENLLDDSSQCGPVIIHETDSNRDSNDDDVVNVDDLDSNSEQLESLPNDSELESDIDEIDMEEEVVEEENEQECVNVDDDDGVINISSSSSSSSDSDSESSKSDDNNDGNFGGASHGDFNTYDDIKYDLNNELGIVPPMSSQQPQAVDQFEQVADYNITEMQPAPIQLDVPTQEQAMNEMIYGDLNVADAEMLNLDVHNDAFGFEMHGNREKILGDHHGIHTNMVEIPNTVSQSLVLDEAKIADSAQQTSSGAGAPPQESENVEAIQATSNANDENDVTSSITELVGAAHGESNIVVDSNEPQTRESVEQPVETSKSEDNRTENVESDAGKNLELSSEVNIQPHNETTNESNVLDNAMIIDETVMAKEEEEATHSQAAGIQSSQMEIDTTNEQPKQSEMVESTEIESDTSRTEPKQPLATEIEEQMSCSTSKEKYLSIKLRRSEVEHLQAAQNELSQSTASETANSQSPNEDTANETNILDKAMVIDETTAVAEEDEAAHSQAADTQSEQMEMDVDNEQRKQSNAAKLRATRSKSQQPRTIETDGVTETQRKKRSASVVKDYAIKLNRSEVKQLLASQNDLVQSTGSSSSVEKSNRTKRAGSEQKEQTAARQKQIESEPVQSDTQTTTNSQQSTESSRRKRGNSQQKELPKNATADEEPSTSKTTIPKRQRTKSTTDSELGEKFDAEESVPSRRLRKAISQQSLSDISENTNDEMTSTKSRTPRKSAPRRAVSQQSLSSTSDSDSKLVNEPAPRATRSKSTQSLQSIESDAAASTSPRAKRTTSKQPSNTDTNSLKRKTRLDSETSGSELGDKFDADESSRSRRLRKAISHQTLSKIDEHVGEVSTPEKIKTPRKAAAPRRAESYQSLSSASLSDSKTGAESAQRVTRSKSIQSVQSNDSDATSVASRSKRGPSKQRSDDANSQKETKTLKRKKDLPPIPEDDSQAQSILPPEYLETSRLTRSQRATIEKHAKPKEKTVEVSTPSKRNTRKTKDDTESTKSPTSDHSDTESVASQKSSVSKASKRSKTSEASSSQRSTRLRTQRK